MAKQVVQMQDAKTGQWKTAVVETDGSARLQQVSAIMKDVVLMVGMIITFLQSRETHSVATEAKGAAQVAAVQSASADQKAGQAAAQSADNGERLAAVHRDVVRPKVPAIPEPDDRRPESRRPRAGVDDGGIGERLGPSVKASGNQSPGRTMTAEQLRREKARLLQAYSDSDDDAEREQIRQEYMRLKQMEAAGAIR